MKKLDLVIYFPAFFRQSKGKGKFYPRTGHEDPKVE
jgi:hypothetical protein